MSENDLDGNTIEAPNFDAFFPSQEQIKVTRVTTIS